jgi:hypothetical protein
MTLDDVHPEIRKLAVAWGEGMNFDMINTMKLGMDIQECFNKMAAPKKSTRPDNEYHTVFDAWFRMLTDGAPYEMKKKDWVGIAQIKRYCEDHCKVGEPLDSFSAVLKHYPKLPKYYQENRNPSFIGSRLSEIISLLKTPASQNNGKVSTAQVLKAAEAVKEADNNSILKLAK